MLPLWETDLHLCLSFSFLGNENYIGKTIAIGPFSCLGLPNQSLGLRTLPDQEIRSLNSLCQTYGFVWEYLSMFQIQWALHSSA